MDTQSPNLMRVLSRLDNVKHHNGYSTARCPAHNDYENSLSIREKDGNVLLKCFVDCTSESIVKAIDLTMSDLFIDGHIPRQNLSKTRISEKTWDIKDPAGDLVAKHLRVDYSDGSKTFYWKRNGAWGLDDLGVEDIPLYGSESLHTASLDTPVVICEGEKAKDALAESKYLPLGTVTGASACPSDRVLNALLGRKGPVILWADNDEPGKQHMERIAYRLEDLGIEPYIIQWPDAPAKGDAVDFIARGGDIEDLVSKACRWQPQSNNQGLSESENTTGFALTDSGNAERLVHLYGDIIHYCPERKKWLIWDERVWTWDNADGTGILALTKQVARSIYHEAGNQDNSDERRKITKHAIQSESDQRRKAMVHLAQSEPGVAINLSNLDADPWLINCAKGTIDLHTGTLYPHSREDLLTVLIPVTYDPIAECPRWIEFLNTVMGGDQELIDYLQRAVGYSLTGDTRSQIVFFLHGLGSNGKSTFLLIIRKMLGGYGAKADSSVFMINDSKSGGPTEGLANLHGKRFVIASEVEDKQRLSVRLIKDMTGGEPIVANRKYEHEVEFQPTHKIWLCGNHKPVISDTTYSIWRRMKLIPFSVTITEVDEQLPMKLESELPGILRWAIEGCLEWQRQGLNEPQGVASATETYRQEQDILFEFLDDRCVKHPLNTVTKKDLCEAYGDWCQGTGTKAVGPRTFTNRLREKGFEEGKSGSNRFWKGIGLIGTDGTEGADNSGKFLNKANNENFLENTAPSVPSVPNPIETCANCQGTDFWMRADGTKLCNRCHPKP